MFESLSGRFEGIFAGLKRKGRLRESDIEEVAGEIRAALLEADVNLNVTDAFVETVKAEALGTEVQESLTPAQQFIKIVDRALTVALGEESVELKPASKPPTVILLAGLQGAGKTTHAGKLAKHLKSLGRQPLLVGADLQRPAALEQLKVLGERIDVPVFSNSKNPVKVAKGCRKEAARLGCNVIVVDTAGRIQVDADLMGELGKISKAVQPDYSLLVVDSMTGQEAANVGLAFNQAIELDGLILTKTDGDARGGAALSVKGVVGKPIMYVGTGEGIEDLERFHPDRMASRILGMGDALTLIEKAEGALDEKEAARAEEILKEGKFTLDDFLAQLQQIKKLGPLKNVMGMMPGMPANVKDADIDERQLDRVEAIVHSMTPEERSNPKLISGSRRSRIARGSGTRTSDVNQLLKQFKQMQQMMKSMSAGPPKGSRKNRRKGKGKGKKGSRAKKANQRGSMLPPAGSGMPDLGELDSLLDQIKDNPKLG